MKGHPPLGNILRDLNEQAHFVTEFHEELRNQLSSAAKIFLENPGYGIQYPSNWKVIDNIGEVFKKMKPRFLVYAPFVESCNNVDKMIELMKCDQSVLEAVDSFEHQMMAEMDRTNNRKLPTSFNTLLSLPFQHILR